MSGDNTHVSATYTEAIQHPDIWKSAIEDELHMIEERKVWHLILEGKVPTEKKTISCCWVLANKYNVEGQIVCQKARLVAKGYSQMLGEDYDETYATIVCLESLQIMVAVTAVFGLCKGDLRELWNSHN